jgi:Ca2+-binding RTX toxin-like protein
MYYKANGSVIAESGATSNWIAAGFNRIGTKLNDVFYSGAAETLAGGDGDDTYHLWNGGAQITEIASAGIDTVYTYFWGAITLPDNVENLVVASVGLNKVTGNSSSNLIKLGVSGATVDAGAGDDVIVGGAGADVFRIGAGNGSDSIYNFTPGWDVVSLYGYSITSFDMLLSKASQVGTDVAIQLSPTEKLVLRGVQLDKLGAADFNLPITTKIAVDSTTHLYKAQQAWNANGWYVHNNVFNAAGLVEGKDYAIESHFNLKNMTDGTSFSWEFPLATDQFPTIRAFPELIFGHSPLNSAPTNPTDKAAVFPFTVGSISSFVADHDLSYGGNLGGFNVAYDIWLASSATGGKESITNEVMIWVHKGAFDAYGTQIGTYTDAQGNTAKIYHKDTYTAVVFDKELPAAVIDIGKILQHLGTLGIVKDSEYVRSVELGAEVVSGSGTLVFNNFDLKVATTTPDGGIITKSVTGSGTDVVAIKPVEAILAVEPVQPLEHQFASGVAELRSELGQIIGSKTTTVNGAVADVVTRDIVGRITLQERATVSDDKVTIERWDAAGKFLGSSIEHRAPDQSLWLTSYDAMGKMTGSVRSVQDGAGTVVKQYYDGNSNMVGADRIVTAPGGVTTHHYDSAFKLTGAQEQIVNAAGDVTTRHYNAEWKMTHYDVAKVVNGESRVYHYSADKVLQTIDVLRDMGGGVIKSVLVDAKWNGLSATIQGTDGADALWGSNYLTDFHSGRGADIIGCAAGVDRIHFDTAPVQGEADQIRYFQAGQDKIVIDSKLFGIAPGSATQSWLALGSKALDADDRVIYDRSKGMLWFDADGAGGKDPILIATLTNKPTLSAADFILGG